MYIYSLQYIKKPGVCLKFGLGGLLIVITKTISSNCSLYTFSYFFLTEDTVIIMVTCEIHIANITRHLLKLMTFCVSYGRKVWFEKQSTVIRTVKKPCQTHSMNVHDLTLLQLSHAETKYVHVEPRDLSKKEHENTWLLGGHKQVIYPWLLGNLVIFSPRLNITL